VIRILSSDFYPIKNLFTLKSNNKSMAASFLPPILTPLVTLFFPGLCFALFFVLIEQEEAR